MKMQTATKTSEYRVKGMDRNDIHEWNSDLTNLIFQKVCFDM
jgi:hypothetical protein